MAEEIGFENGRNSNFQGLVTLTLDPAIRTTVVHHSSTSTYIPNFIEIEETFCGRTYGRTDIFPPSNIIRSTFGSRPNNATYIAQIRAQQQMGCRVISVQTEITECYTSETNDSKSTCSHFIFSLPMISCSRHCTFSKSFLSDLRNMTLSSHGSSPMSA